MQSDKKTKRLKRAFKTRIKLKNLRTTRLVVNRTSKHIYAQVIAVEDSDKVIASASTLDKEFKEQAKAEKLYTGNVEAATLVGKLIANRAKQNGVTTIAFDRSGYQYHGRIKALADAAREAGLEF